VLQRLEPVGATAHPRRSPNRAVQPRQSTLDLPDSDYSLVPESEEGGAEASLQYVEVLDDTEGTQASLADEGKPRCI
jgi:hypothetical protein